MNDENVESLGIAGVSNPVTEFSTGAVRDIQEDKGRCDLMPLGVVADLYTIYYKYYKDFSAIPQEELMGSILGNINSYIYYGDTDNLLLAMGTFICNNVAWLEYEDCNRITYALLDVSKHYKHGLEKYGERNWEKGIPLHSYIDSGVRHLMKVSANFKDERHDLAFIWNLLGCCATDLNISKTIPELRDLPFCKDLNNPDNVISTLKTTMEPLYESIMGNMQYD